MPKREESYMQAQREAIAQATLTVLLDKGLYETSLRDICRAAGISIGALYVHFKTKEEAVIAACALDFLARRDTPPSTSWEDYIGTIAEADRLRHDARTIKRHRLSLQFAAELTQMERNPDGLSTIFQLYRDEIRRSLGRLQELGIVGLPLGLGQTTEIHVQLFLGAGYLLAANRDMPVGQVLETLHQGLAVTAGLIDAG
jgi:AcrR family transcriptional regulator